MQTKTPKSAATPAGVIEALGTLALSVRFEDGRAFLTGPAVRVS